MTSLSLRYFTMGSCTYVLGLPSHMRNTDASDLIAKSWKMVSIHL